jgi:hypothetical protein
VTGSAAPWDLASGRAGGRSAQPGRNEPLIADTLAVLRTSAGRARLSEKETSIALILILLLALMLFGGGAFYLTSNLLLVIIVVLLVVGVGGYAGRGRWG